MAASAVAIAGSAEALDKERQSITAATAGLDAGLVGLVGEDVDVLITRLDELLKAVEELYALTARREAPPSAILPVRVTTYLAAISPGVQRITQDFRNKGRKQRPSACSSLACCRRRSTI